MNTPSTTFSERALATVQQALRATNTFFLGDFPVEPVALARILYGAVLVSSYAFVLPELERLYGAHGLNVHMVPGLAETWVVRHLWTAVAIVISAALCFCVGLFTSLSGIVLIVGHLSFREVSRSHTWGWLSHVHVFVAYLVLARCGAAFSVDAWIKSRLDKSGSVSTVPAAAVRLMQMNIASLYLMVGWHRIVREHWLNGSMVYHALVSTVFTRFPHADLHGLRSTLAVACWIAWIFELAAPILLWVPKMRTACALGLMAMHLGLELTSTVGWWQFAMLALLWVFLPATWARWLLRRGRV